MFRHRPETVPEDFKFPEDLEAFGYFINDADQIRMISHPNQPFNYFASKNDRFVERQKDAMNNFIYDMVMARLTEGPNATMEFTRLPIGTPPESPHVPILTSKNLQRCHRVVLLFGEETQELGTLSGRLISHESISTGSVLNLAEAILEPEKHTSELHQQSKESKAEHGNVQSGAGSFVEGDEEASPKSEVGLIIANPGQLTWHRRSGRAVSRAAWQALPRSSAAASGYFRRAGNYIPRNHTSEDHAACLFEDVVLPLIEKGVKIDIIAVADGGLSVTDFLQRSQSAWETKWSKGISSLAIASGYVWTMRMNFESFAVWFMKRARAYVLHDENIGTELTGRLRFGCNVYASGDNYTTEHILPYAYITFLEYFALVHSIPGFENVPNTTDEEEKEVENKGKEKDHDLPGEKGRDIWLEEDPDGEKGPDGKAWKLKSKGMYQKPQKAGAAAGAQTTEQDKDEGLVETFEKYAEHMERVEKLEKEKAEKEKEKQEQSKPGQEHKVAQPTAEDSGDAGYGPLSTEEEETPEKTATQCELEEPVNTMPLDQELASLKIKDVSGDEDPQFGEIMRESVDSQTTPKSAAKVDADPNKDMNDVPPPPAPHNTPCSENVEIKDLSQDDITQLQLSRASETLVHGRASPRSASALSDPEVPLKQRSGNVNSPSGVTPTAKLGDQHDQTLEKKQKGNEAINDAEDAIKEKVEQLANKGIGGGRDGG